MSEAQVRSFETGATRSADAGRYDPEGFMSPIVIERFCEYMQKHRLQPDGSIRASDNWQKGIPRDTYMKGMWRHTLHAWTRHRGFEVQDPMAAKDLEEDLCAILFNVQGMLFELLRERRRASVQRAAPAPLPTEPSKLQEEWDRWQRERAAQWPPSLLRTNGAPEWPEITKSLEVAPPAVGFPLPQPHAADQLPYKAQLLDDPNA